MSHYFTNDYVKSEEKEINIIVKNTKLTLLTDNGIFSKHGLDFGTRTLLESLNLSELKGDILDFGCGYGPIGIYLKKTTNANIDMLDINKRALNLARKNAKKNEVNVNIFESDLYQNVTKKYDYIICVPMYIKKKKKRGYDQAELIAEELSKLCNIPIEKGNLIRTKNTLAQSKVSFEDRAKNVKGVFKVLNPDKIKNKNILLIDDIYTTGNTINYCGKALKQAGANNICYFTLAKVIYKQNLDID